MMLRLIGCGREDCKRQNENWQDFAGFQHSSLKALQWENAA
jgi:hypothetical protein